MLDKSIPQIDETIKQRMIHKLKNTVQAARKMPNQDYALTMVENVAGTLLQELLLYFTKKRLENGHCRIIDGEPYISGIDLDTDIKTAFNFIYMTIVEVGGQQYLTDEFLN